MDEKKYKVHPLDINLKARQLSGGNLQKVVVARELFKRPKLVIAEQPSRDWTLQLPGKYGNI